MFLIAHGPFQIKCVEDDLRVSMTMYCVLEHDQRQIAIYPTIKDKRGDERHSSKIKTKTQNHRLLVFGLGFGFRACIQGMIFVFWFALGLWLGFRERVWLGLRFSLSFRVWFQGQNLVLGLGFGDNVMVQFQVQCFITGQGLV